MSKISFGYESNGKICSCGNHHGLGTITPEDRAARLARMREKMPKIMTPDMNAFLADFEKYHGTVKYDMVRDGVMEGHFVKSNKGQPLMVAHYNFNSDKYQESKLF